jgi:hypothetical protein
VMTTRKLGHILVDVHAEVRTVEDYRALYDGLLRLHTWLDLPLAAKLSDYLPAPEHAGDRVWGHLRRLEDLLKKLSDSLTAWTEPNLTNTLNEVEHARRLGVEELMELPELKGRGTTAATIDLLRMSAAAAGKGWYQQNTGIRRPEIDVEMMRARLEDLLLYKMGEEPVGKRTMNHAQLIGSVLALRWALNLPPLTGMTHHLPVSPMDALIQSYPEDETPEQKNERLEKLEEAIHRYANMAPENHNPPIESGRGVSAEVRLLRLMSELGSLRGRAARLFTTERIVEVMKKGDPFTIDSVENVTLGAIVTLVKMRGSGAHINGVTTPEGWGWSMCIAVGSPGNVPALELAREYGNRLQQLGAPKVAEIAQARHLPTYQELMEAVKPFADMAAVYASFTPPLSARNKHPVHRMENGGVGAALSAQHFETLHVVMTGKVPEGW